MIKWSLPDGDFMLRKKDKRFTEHMAFIHYEQDEKARWRYRVVKFERASIFQKGNEKLILLQSKYGQRLSRLMKKNMLSVMEVKKPNGNGGENDTGGVSEDKKEEAPQVHQQNQENPRWDFPK